MSLFANREVSLKLMSVTFGKEHVVQRDGLLYLSEDFENALEAYGCSGGVSKKFDDFGDRVFELSIAPRGGAVMEEDIIELVEGETIIVLGGKLRKLEDFQ